MPVTRSELESETSSGTAHGHSDARFQRVCARLAFIAAAGWICYTHPGALLVIGVLVIGAVIPFTPDIDRRQAITMVLAIAVGVATLDYVSWRVSVTNWGGWWISVPLLAAEAFGAAHVLGFQFTIWPRRTPPLESTEDATLYPVFIFIPTVNEGSAILRRTLTGCIAARDAYLEEHPHAQVAIVVCNDGRAANVSGWQEIDALADELGVFCVTRVVGGGAKAGNVENARQKVQATGDALVVIFDADQVPEASFLLKTIGPFADPKVGWVQTGQYYGNQADPAARWADDQQSMFYNVLCPGKAALNAAFICGTNVVIRARALDEIGGFPQDSVTEDFAASISLHPRWRSVYMTEVLATGLGPFDVPAYLKQQNRWALGTLGVFRSHWRDILLPRRRGLQPAQRAQYLLACTHYLCGLRDVIFMLSPIVFILTGIPAVRQATLGDYLWHFVPYALLVIAAMWYATRGVTGLRGIIIGFGSFPALMSSLVAVVLGKKKPFATTAKRRSGYQSLRYIWIYIVLLLICVAALISATQVSVTEQASLFISLFWVVYSMLLLSSFLWLVYRDVRAHAAAKTTSPGVLAAAPRPYRSRLETRNRSLRPAYNLALAAILASPILVSTKVMSMPPFWTGAAMRFSIAQEIDSRHVGVALPVRQLTTQGTLEADLGVPFSIVGRTQDIRDRFDRSWAQRLDSQGARPWITLEFGEVGRNHLPPLAANLPAIYNGLHDRELSRWAAEISEYGKPVYLTVLLHADKNWSVSSGVANGGIPQDVARAWTHIQQVFRWQQASNVAWVWAPADPLHDQAFAPPRSTIDAVLQSFVNYPGTKWGNPRRVLGDLSHRYPAMPVFIEVSAAGSPSRKATWLRSLGRAIVASPGAYALLYHEGGPGLAPSRTEQQRWSLASDPQSRAAMKKIAEEFQSQPSP
jgi:cellulose synthase (UDP-forming)